LGGRAGLQLSIQAILDIASHIAAGLAFPTPHDYRELLLTLGERGVLPAEFAEQIAGIAGFRSILVHEYLRVDLREVYRALHERLDDFREFARQIALFLQKTP
jgi:uncharacterized protein YutE (UPF0331/DUF86 family)